MLRYGPRDIGSRTCGPAVPNRWAGNQDCRIGDGDYAAISGSPSMTMTHRGAYLGIEPANVASTLRVMDFYRCESRRLIGNWVPLDHVDRLRQWGIDVLAKAGETG